MRDLSCSKSSRRAYDIAGEIPVCWQDGDWDLPAGSKALHSRLRQRAEGAPLHHNGCPLLYGKAQRCAILVQWGKPAAVACNEWAQMRTAAIMPARSWMAGPPG